MTGRTTTPPSFARRGLVEAEHDDLGVHGFRGPGEHRKPPRHGHLLRAARGIGDHATAERTAELLPPQLLARGGIERVEVAADIAEEHDPTGGGRHAGDDRIVGLDAPLPDAGVGVDGVNPTGPRANFQVAECPERVPRRHTRPWLSDGDPAQLIDVLRPYDVAQLDLAYEDEVGLRNVGGAVPLRASRRPRAETDGLAVRGSFLHVLDPGHRHAVELTVV